MASIGRVLRSRLLPACGGVLCLLLLGGCGEDLGAPTPAAPLTPTPSSQAPAVYLLVPRQVPGYKRTTDRGLSAAQVVAEKNDPSLRQRLSADGFISGAQVAYAPPRNGAPAAFTVVIEDALIFGDARGANAYFREERSRIAVRPANGTIDSIRGAPTRNTSALAAFAAEQAPQGSDEVDRAFISLIRSGRVVVELFARGAHASSTTQAAFLPLMSALEDLLATPAG